VQNRIGQSAAQRLDGYTSTTGSTRLLDGANIAGLDELIRAAQSEMNAGKRKEMVARGIKMVEETYVIYQIARVPMMVVSGPRVSLDDWPSPAANSYPPTYAYRTQHAK